MLGLLGAVVALVVIDKDEAVLRTLQIIPAAVSTVNDEDAFDGVTILFTAQHGIIFFADEFEGH